MAESGPAELSSAELGSAQDAVRSLSPRLRAVLATLAAAGILAGCAASPERLTLAEQISHAAADRNALYTSQEPVSGPVRLEEALARALKYNLDHRVALMERALEERLGDSAQMDLLPQLAGRAGLRTRDNVSASSSRSVESGQQSLEPSTSSDRDAGTADLQLSLNVLDFGLSYFGAQAQGNRALAAEERRRRVVLTVADEVRSAYWEAVTAEQLAPRVRSVLAEAREALAFARQAETERLMPPLETLQFQRAMLETIQQLEGLESELASAKAELAGLMGLPPGTSYSLAPPRQSNTRLPYRLPDLEAVAMVERPEIREELYNARNVAIEARSQMLSLMPGANLFAGVNYDSNSFLLNQSWADAGIQVTWNLLRVLSLPGMQAEAQAREELSDARRLALRMAILTQVNVAYRRYQRATGQYARAAELQQVEQRIAEATRSAEESDAQNRLERVRAAAAAVLAQRARNRAFAEVNNALGAIYAASGFDPLPETIADHDLATLQAAIASRAAEIASGRARLPDIPESTAPTASLEPATRAQVGMGAIATDYAMLPPPRPANPARE
ncbi:MAG: TolC family protein [Salinarimonas sp.]|nr:TolC family protein [Salinarimonas sp.]